jgi:hypothetical protein
MQCVELSSWLPSLILNALSSCRSPVPEPRMVQCLELVTLDGSVVTVADASHSIEVRFTPSCLRALLDGEPPSKLRRSLLVLSSWSLRSTSTRLGHEVPAGEPLGWAPALLLKVTAARYVGGSGLQLLGGAAADVIRTDPRVAAALATCCWANLQNVAPRCPEEEGRGRTLPLNNSTLHLRNPTRFPPAAAFTFRWGHEGRGGGAGRAESHGGTAGTADTGGVLSAGSACRAAVDVQAGGSWASAFAIAPLDLPSQGNLSPIDFGEVGEESPPGKRQRTEGGSGAEGAASQSRAGLQQRSGRVAGRV